MLKGMQFGLNKLMRCPCAWKSIFRPFVCLFVCLFVCSFFFINFAAVAAVVGGSHGFGRPFAWVPPWQRLLKLEQMFFASFEPVAM